MTAINRYLDDVPTKRCEPLYGSCNLASGHAGYHDAYAKCMMPPDGYSCTRYAGHDGPCAAVEKPREPVAAAHREQEMPVKNDQPCIQDMVIADIEKRKAIGLQRYGTLLQPFNGRDSLRDAYEEALDLCQYLRQALEERAQLEKAGRPA